MKPHVLFSFLALQPHNAAAFGLPQFLFRTSSSGSMHFNVAPAGFI
jgi:hypothetical protein